MRTPWTATAVVVMSFLGGRAEAQSPSPTPSPAPTPSPTTGRLRLDIEKHVERRLAEEEAKGVPRFQTQVEVVGKSPQVMLDRYFGGVDLECTPGGAPPAGGAPTHVEMREARGHSTPTADLGALVRLISDLARKKSKGPDRYFLYRVHGKDGVSYLLREGRMPEQVLYAARGATYELLATFSDAKDGARALRRLERGFATAEARSAPPPADWQTSTCRPR